MNTPLLLDTCAAIWAAEDQLAPAAADLLTQSYRRGEPVYLSPITAWELGLLFSRGRLRAARSPLDYFRHLINLPGVRLAAMPPELLLASSFLPDSPPSDPADRIMATTAREYGYTLMTRDDRLLAYAEQGHIRAFAC
ncbi:MAG TPA: type II toxin-antitoxin system VapC family toxin [Micropepsaceae bacterium]|jgi:PIN domain nuclease of toxin-antitoxin system